MPYKPARQCPGLGPNTSRCPNLIKGKERYCPTCSEYSKKAVRRYDKARDQTPERKFIHSPLWRKIRKRKLAQDPLCEMCLKAGEETMADRVHHIDGNELHNNMDNLLSVCNDHHLILHKGDVFGRKRGNNE